MCYIWRNHGHVRNSLISASSRYLTMVLQTCGLDAELQYVLSFTSFASLIVWPVGVKNHVYFMAFILTLVAGVLIFDFLVWTRKHRRHLVILFTLNNWVQIFSGQRTPRFHRLRVCYPTQPANWYRQTCSFSRLLYGQLCNSSGAWWQ